MKNKQQNIEINPETAAWFETFPDMSGRQGMTQIIEDTAYLLPGNPMTAMFHDPVQAHSFMLGAWKNIWRHSLVGMKGLFTIGELSLFVDIHNGRMVTPQTYGGNCLAVGVSDSITLEGIDKKWGVDPAAILEKINGLTHIQAACLELWANGYWYGATSELRNFDKYIAQLA